MELKSCPFCGSKATRLCAYDRNDIIKLVDEEEYEIALGVGVYCRNCGVRTKFYKEVKEAADAWNRRKADGNAT